METIDEISTRGTLLIMEFSKWYKDQILPVPFDMNAILLLSVFYGWLEDKRINPERDE